jgi:diguanylate cyclase
VSRSPRHAGAALAFLLAVYIGLDATTQVIPPHYLLPPDVLTALRWLNMTIVFIMFGYTGRYYIERVTEAETRLRELATRDAMSGLWNRRHLLTLAHAEMARAKRSGYPLVVVLADIDHFKRVNDRHGHDAGDRVIEYVSRMLREHLRAGDLVGRWGGEEFIAVLPSCDTMAAHQLCERLRQRIADTPCQVNGVPIKVTMSFGVHPLLLDSLFEQAVKQADEALYKAKHTGRNRVVSNLPQPVLEGALQV